MNAPTPMESPGPGMRRCLVVDMATTDDLGSILQACNARGPWIEEVTTRHDPRVKDWLQAAEVTEVSWPAIVRMEEARVSVVQGDMFRWRALQLLGPEYVNALRRLLRKETDQAIPGDPSHAPSQVRQRRAPGPIARRRFLGLSDRESQE